MRAAITGFQLDYARYDIPGIRRMRTDEDGASLIKSGKKVEAVVGTMCENVTGMVSNILFLLIEKISSFLYNIPP
jgi:hypothetical protein